MARSSIVGIERGRSLPFTQIIAWNLFIFYAGHELPKPPGSAINFHRTGHSALIFLKSGPSITPIPAKRASSAKLALKRAVVTR